MRSLEKAIKAASEDDILLFCSTSDQGKGVNDTSYPGNCNSANRFRIGAGTAMGGVSDIVALESIDYVCPGDPLTIESWPSTYKAERREYRGSSLATALAAGLAALILHCVALWDPSKVKSMSTHQRMTEAFEAIGETNEKFLKVWDVLKASCKEADDEKVVKKLLHQLFSKSEASDELGLL